MTYLGGFRAFVYLRIPFLFKEKGQGAGGAKKISWQEIEYGCLYQVSVNGSSIEMRKYERN